MRLKEDLVYSFSVSQKFVAVSKGSSVFEKKISLEEVSKDNMVQNTNCL
jgi:hypothetical protein